MKFLAHHVGMLGLTLDPPFEEALVKFGEEGAVILLDEIEKVGGKGNDQFSKKARDQFLNTLYGITDRQNGEARLKDLRHVAFYPSL